MTTATAPSNAVTVTGEFIRATAEKGNWFAGLLTCSETGERVSFCGASPLMPPIGSELAITGKWEDRGQWGMQLKAERISYSTPTTREGALRVLKTLPGIGEARARALIDQLGADTVIRKLLDNPEQLEHVPGIGKKGAEAIQHLKEQRELFEVEAELSNLGLGPRTSANAIEHFGGIEATAAVLQTNPYRLVEVDRVSFRRVDEYLLKTQRFPADSPFRAAAAIIEALNEAASSDGHTWVPRSQIGDALDRLKLGVPIPAGVVETALESSVKKGALVLVHAGEGDGAEEGYTTPSMDRAERYIAAYFERLLDAPALPVKGEVDPKTWEWLTEEQRAAVEFISTGNLLVLTGGPGVGKSATTSAILDVLGRDKTLIAAPTGKAAKRASELTGAEATTIHRLAGRLEKLAIAIRDEGASHGLWPRAVIIDEASMVSCEIASLLLSALDPRDLGMPLVRIVLVGDVDQLPPIGPGAVLRDCIATPRVPSVRLTKIHRQAEGSAIVTNAHRIIGGEYPVEPQAKGLGGYKDWYQINVEKGENDLLAAKVIELHKRARSVFGIDERDIMVLSPQRAGAVGINALNAALREVVNPPSDDPTEPVVTMPFHDRGAAKGSEKPTLRRGDRVLVTKNDYNLGVVNGDLGLVEEVIPSSGQRGADGKVIEDCVAVSIDGEDCAPVLFRGDNVAMLRHAYCLSVHKSQGSQARAVIVVVTSSHYRMLSRRLVYTAVTRAKELLILAGDRSGLGMALKGTNEGARRTRLAHLLETGGA